MPMLSRKPMLNPEDAVALLEKFDALIPRPQSPLRVDEVRTALNVSDDQVRNYIESGELDAVIDVRGCDASRGSARVTRYSLLRFMVRRRML